MPKYITTSSSYFEPFTYDQLSAPIREMAEIHRASQDAYDQYASEAEALRRYLEQEPGDSDARKMYDAYMTKLSDLQNNLWSNGYNAQTRRDLSAARAGYASDITRLGTAIKSRQERSAEYNKYKHEHPDAIMGDDPGLANLDEYLHDDLYGQNYFNYSGNQFAKEVGDDIKSRAAALRGDPMIQRNPELFGYLTRIATQGLTNEEANNATSVIRMLVGDDPARINGITPEALSSLGLDDHTTLAAQVLLSHLQSTGAAGRVSKDEFNRLVNFGGFGLASGVLGPDVKDFNDVIAQNNLEFSTWKAKQDYLDQLDAQKELRKAAAKAATQGGDGSLVINDKESYTVEGKNAKRSERKTREYSTSPETLLRAHDGTQVTNNVDASSVVFSEELRQRAMERIPWDIGRDPTIKGKVAHNSNYLRGTITDKNGKEWEVQYNPYKRLNGKKGVIEVRSGRGSFKIDPDLTEYYDNMRGEYQRTLDMYKNAEPGSDMAKIYKMAKIDPDKQAKDYKKYGIDKNVPLSDFRTAVADQPGNYTGMRDDTYVARAGEDPEKGYVHRISQLLSANFTKGTGLRGALPWNWFSTMPLYDSGTAKDPQRREHKGTSEYIHEIGKDGQLKKRVADADNVFKFDDNYNITNISSVQVSPESIKEGCFIVKVSGGGDKKYAVNIDMLGSMQLASKFERAKAAIQEVERNGNSSAEKEVIASWLSSQMRSDIGYNLYPQIKGNTVKDDTN